MRQIALSSAKYKKSPLAPAKPGSIVYAGTIVQWKTLGELLDLEKMVKEGKAEMIGHPDCKIFRLLCEWKIEEAKKGRGRKS